MSNWPVFKDIRGRTPELENALEALKPGQRAAKANLTCVWCGNKIHGPEEFRNVTAIREFYITGICQSCQDEFYSGEG